MTDQQIVLQAIVEMQRLMRGYIQPGPRDPDHTMGELLRILDDEKLVAAQERIAAERNKPGRR